MAEPADYSRLTREFQAVAVAVALKGIDPSLYNAPEELMISLNADNFEHEISEGIVIVDFYADWCGPCLLLKPMLEEVSKEHDVKVCTVDIDDNEQLVSQFGICNVPTLLFFKNGEQKEKTVGVRTKKDLEGIILGLN